MTAPWSCFWRTASWDVTLHAQKTGTSSEEHATSLNDFPSLLNGLSPQSGLLISAIPRRSIASQPCREESVELAAGHRISHVVRMYPVDRLSMGHCEWLSDLPHPTDLVLPIWSHGDHVCAICEDASRVEEFCGFVQGDISLCCYVARWEASSTQSTFETK